MEEEGMAVAQIEFINLGMEIQEKIGGGRRGINATKYKERFHNKFGEEDYSRARVLLRLCTKGTNDIEVEKDSFLTGEIKKNNLVFGLFG